MKLNLYEALGLPRDAASAEIQQRCLKLMAKYHPDKHPQAFDPFPGRIFRLAGEGERVLCNAALRAEHDRLLDLADVVPVAAAAQPATTPVQVSPTSAAAAPAEPSILDELMGFGADLLAERMKKAFRRRG